MKFNREKSKEYKSLQCNNKTKVEGFGKIFLTSFGVVLLLFLVSLSNKINPSEPINYEDTKPSIQHIASEYDISRGEYLDRVNAYEEEFTNRELLNFYNDGKISFTYNGENIVVTVKSLYLRYGYNDDEKFIFLSNVLNGRNVDLFTGENNSFAEKEGIIEFRNTTIFELLYSNYSPVGNLLVLNEEETLEFLDYIANWDGKINDIVPKTMAVINKQVWEVSNEERKR